MATDGPAEDAPAPASSAPSLARSTAVMSVGTAASRITGFVRLSVMAWAIGGAESKLPDTYNLANSLPNIVYQLVLGEILATVFVPVFVEYIKTRARDEAWKLASTILNAAFLIAGLFAIVTVIAAPWIIKIYTFRVPDPVVRAEMEATGAFFLRIFMPQMIFYAMGAVLTGLLNAHRKFAAPMFAPVLNNLIVIATFIVFRSMHGGGVPNLATLTGAEKWVLAGGTTLGVIVFTMVLWPFVRKLPGGYQPRAWEWRHPAVRHVGTLAKYSFGYVIINQLGLWVVYMLANRTEGGISAFQAAFILYQLPYGIFAVSVMTALVPSLAEHHVNGDLRRFREDLSLGLRTTAFVVLPAAAGFVALGAPIIRLLLEHGVFSAESTKLYADTFVLMAAGLYAYAAFQQIMRAFYARQDTKTPWIVNGVAVLINIAVDVPLYRSMGVPGLALGHTISYVFALAYGGYLLRRELKGIDGRRLLSSHLRIGLASVVTAAASWAVARLVERTVGVETLGGQLLQVGGAVTAGLILYASLSIALRLDEFRPLVRMVTGRFGRRASTRNGSQEGSGS
ncbi:MAG TPA: murein biosynthesis integral membrane protein MurJ [Actinomycetota bacterium]|nr:murein biosynthesis integral membrane protein MurJ [Actinomycetota bacterium]